MNLSPSQGVEPLIFPYGKTNIRALLKIIKFGLILAKPFMIGQ
jgi:hypothetical protein